MCDERYKLLKDIASKFHKLRGKSLDHNDASCNTLNLSEGEVRTTYAFSVNSFLNNDKYGVKYEKVVFSYNKNVQSSLGLVFYPEYKIILYIGNCWCPNSIRFQSEHFMINNVIDTSFSIYFGPRHLENELCLRLENMNEEWLFQLETMYDIPCHKEILEIVDIRNYMKYDETPTSFEYKFKRDSEEHEHSFLLKVQEFLNEQN